MIFSLSLSISLLSLMLNTGTCMITENAPVMSIAVGLTFEQCVSRFNSNVSYSGLLHAVTQDVSSILN